ncbi:MAG TPA: serine/threonine-protein kinase [Kofleriaceae bacterium]|nr:serine/threonine-protein kinase [Kofleriaceae bacterium]
MGAADPHSSFNALLPEQFGKYSLLGHLATGGMAEVWLARQLGMQGFEKIVVIKRARPELTDVETTEFFLDEARLVATLEHPNIAQVYEIGFVNGSYFFVMEYVDGADLRRLIETALSRQRWIPLGDALYIITHVCTALHYAHEKKDLEGRALHIIHRDVSPSNVLISHDGAIKVCDFGIAKAHNRKSEDTQSGVLKGKFSYMSPEQCQSQPIDRRSDVFSIGILLYELTTLSKLFRGGSDYALLRKIIDGPIPPPSTRVSGYPRELEAIVMKALAKSPADRYPTAQALQLDLEAFAREHKLVMSSIGIAKLMGELFERRNDAWIRAQRAHSDHFIVAGEAGGSGNLPAFLAVGSAPAASTGEAVLDNGVPVPHLPGHHKSRPVSMSATVQTGQSAASLHPVTTRRRGALLLLAGAVAAAVLAVGVTVANQAMVNADDHAAESALHADVERITSTFDSIARSAHMRADGIATTPMLRAAIETDAATLRDLANTEMVFNPGKGEALEVFQFRSDNKSVSLLRIPKNVNALPALKGRDTQLHLEGSAVTLYASAPISGYRAELVGGLVISVPVDLAPLKRALEDHAVTASITGLKASGGTVLQLVGSGTPPASAAVGHDKSIKLAVPSGGEWNAGSAMLVATPKRAGGLTWAAPVRNLSGGLGVLLLIGFVVSLVRRPRA